MTRIRARIDCSWLDADHRLALDAGSALAFLTEAERVRILALPPIEPGDAWQIKWSSSNLAGYAFCCPRCRSIHPVTIASNCTTTVINGRCEHSRLGSGSCWEWTGDLAAGTLTASPSLDIGECGWHGWLRNGVFEEA